MGHFFPKHKPCVRFNILKISVVGQNSLASYFPSCPAWFTRNIVDFDLTHYIYGFLRIKAIYLFFQ